VTEPAIESELKLLADGEAPLDELALRETLGPAQLGPALTVTELDRYLDTADLRLAGSGWACRLRTRDGAASLSLKGPAEHLAGAALHRRPELNGPATPGADPARWPSSAARDRLLAMAAGEPLVERLALAQTRTEREVRWGVRRVGTLSLDRVHVLHHGSEIGRLNLVELELDPEASGGDLDPEPLSRALQTIGGLRLDPLSKLEHALTMIEGAAR
jgi:inorganic triphosphatase YgiF